MTLVPVPGFGAGTPRRRGKPRGLRGPAVLGAHTWKPGWDPEGPLSTLPAIATTLFGAIAGALLAARMELRRKTRRLCWARERPAPRSGPLGNCLPDQQEPLDVLLRRLHVGPRGHRLALCLWIVDVRGWKAWAAPFRWLGRNALAIFTLSLLAT